MEQGLYKTLAIIVCLAIVGSTFSIIVPKVMSESVAKMAINPQYAVLQDGENMTFTITATDVSNVFGWQVALKYDANIVYCTGAWIPEDSVFGDKTKYFAPDPVLNEPTLDGQNYLLIGVTSLGGSVNILNGTLFKINFTTQSEGQTNLFIAQEDNPVVFGQAAADKQYSFFLDADLGMIPFTTEQGTIVVGTTNAKPIASMVMSSSPVDNRSNLVLNGNSPPGTKDYVQGYTGVTLLLNASGSFDPTGGRITEYDWNLGNGDTIKAEDAVITYAYNLTGVYTVRLTVWNDGSPSLVSEPVTRTVVIGMLLPYFDWTPYILALLVLVIVGALLYGFRVYRQRKRLPFKI